MQRGGASESVSMFYSCRAFPVSGNNGGHGSPLPALLGLSQSLLKIERDEERAVSGEKRISLARSESESRKIPLAPISRLAGHPGPTKMRFLRQRIAIVISLEPISIRSDPPRAAQTFSAFVKGQKRAPFLPHRRQQGVSRYIFEERVPRADRDRAAVIERAAERLIYAARIDQLAHIESAIIGRNWIAL